jgi:hypothetical protein
VFNATTCQTQASPDFFLTFFYLTLAVFFGCICLAAGVLVVKLVRARHTFALRTVHTGTCVYVAMFIPYAALQAATLGQLGFLNSQGADSISRSSVQINSRAAFAVFFGLGFSGKVALVQMWAQVVQLHASGGSSVSTQLRGTLTTTYKAFVWIVVIIVTMYVIGFAVLTDKSQTGIANCVSKQDSRCLSGAHEQPCQQIDELALMFQYYEGIWAGLVLLIFTILAFLFNGVVFAM